MEDDSKVLCNEYISYIYDNEYLFSFCDTRPTRDNCSAVEIHNKHSNDVPDLHTEPNTTNNTNP